MIVVTFAAVAIVGEWASWEWLSYIKTASPAVLAVVAVWALIFARRQFGTSEKHLEVAKKQADAAQESIRHSKVAALFELDRVFESQEMAGNRRELKEFRRGVQREIDSDDAYRSFTADQIRALLQDKCAAKLYEMSEAGELSYYKILNAVGFFETVGFMVERDYLKISDIVRLYGGTIIWVDEVMAGHIKKEREKEDDDEYLEFFSYLVKKTRELKDQP